MKSDAVFELADSDRPAFLVNAAGEIILANPSARAEAKSWIARCRLARTVSLDFNNALTSILGHTSLLLGKAEPGIIRGGVR
jgi:hypothetical protein